MQHWDPSRLALSVENFFVQENVLTNRLHARIWLLKTYAIPASMYASQIWSTPFLKQGKEMDNPVQKWLLTMLKRILGVWDTTPSWCVRYARVWPWAFTVQLVSCHNASLQISDPMQQHYCQTSFTCWLATELQVWWLLVLLPILFQPWLVWYWHAVELLVSWMLVLPHSFSHGRLDTILHV